MYQFRKILGMDIAGLYTNPMWIFYTTGFPFLMTVILGFLTNGSYGAGVTSYDYFGVTLMIFSALNASTLAANSFMENRIMKANMRVLTAPVPHSQIYLSKILATVIFSTVNYTATGIVLHLLFGVNFGGGNTWLLWLILVLVEFFSAALSVMLCCIFKSEETTNQIVSNVTMLMALFGGLFFPINSFGKAVRVLSHISPMKWVADASFQLIYDNDLSLYLPVCLILVLGTLLWVVLCKKFFNGEDYV